MNFCSQCGDKVTFVIPEGDHRERHVCPSCDTIFYDNPRVIAGTLPVYQNKILICKRGIEPRADYWTIPGGFLENGESLSDGALRETLEESCAHVVNQQLLSIISLPSVNQIHCFYLSKMDKPDFEVTPESTEIRLVSLDEIPWQEIAFKTVEQTLRHYCKYHEQTELPLLESSILPRSF